VHTNDLTAGIVEATKGTYLIQAAEWAYCTVLVQDLLKVIHSFYTLAWYRPRTDSLCVERCVHRVL